jgi:integrase
LKIVEARSSPVALPQTLGFEPKRGDRTVGELLDAYQTAHPSKDAVAPARAVREFIGEKKPVRAVSRDDARRFAAFAETIPANSTKIYRSLTMIEAAERANEDRAAGLDRPRLAPTSVQRYLTYAAMFWNWGIKEGDGLWAERNPFRGLAEGGDTATVSRRGFRDDELIALFAHLRRYKASDSFKFWAPAVLLNGARLSEVCQLRTDDVREVEGVPFLKIHLFDADGRRDPMKSVKTPESIRSAPLHPLTIEAGFMDFVRRRREAGAERLFGDAKPYLNRKANQWDWSHYPSRVLSKAIDTAVGHEPSLVTHSLRHGFRERAERADLAEAMIDAIAGWAQKSVGRGYGERDIPLLARNLARLDYGGLKL